MFVVDTGLTITDCAEETKELPYVSVIVNTGVIDWAVVPELVTVTVPP